MKKILLAILFFAISVTSYAKKEYLCFGFKNSNTFFVCYGDMTNPEEIKDKDGKTIKSYSPSYILNYFAKEGWIYVGFDGSYYIMEREVKEEKE